MFSITCGKGFRITFSNGWTVSVQWGPGNYCENYHMPFGKYLQAGRKGSATAECAVINPEREMITMPGWEDNVRGEMSADEVLELMLAVSKIGEEEK